jgi:hypothetical protein
MAYLGVALARLFRSIRKKRHGLGDTVLAHAAKAIEIEDVEARVVGEEDHRHVEILRERCRRRLDASGEPFADLSQESFDRTRRAPLAEILSTRYEQPRSGAPE